MDNLFRRARAAVFPLRTIVFLMLVATAADRGFSHPWGDNSLTSEGSPLEAAPEGVFAEDGAILLDSQRESGIGFLRPDTRLIPVFDPESPFYLWTQEPVTFQALPSGLIYRSYLAGQKEPRFASTWVNERELGWIWDITMGGRVGLFRYGTQDPNRPEGFQIDMEGAAFPRLDMEHKEDLVAADFRFGMPLTFGSRRFQTKLAFYHLSSHLGDEWMIRQQSLDRINFSRNVLVWGNSYYWTDELRLYAEAGWAFYTNGGSEPWEFQFGAEYAPSAPTGLRPVPFVAINTHLREEVDYGGNLVVQTGWAWRGMSGQLFRMGMQYYTGKSDQYEFFNQFEDKVGLGLWYDY